MTDFHLASASPRRVEILNSLRLSFTAEGVDIDESPRAGEAVAELVIRLAIAKARAAAGQHTVPVLGADTVVTLDGRIFGKPQSKEEALQMLAALSGRCHQVHTAVAILAGGQSWWDRSETSVQFREIGRDEARQYWQSGEPVGKAGGYAIQGLGGTFVESISGSYTGVVGLPVFETARLLSRAGITLFHDDPMQDRNRE